jgi:hypothetical protein
LFWTKEIVFGKINKTDKFLGCIWKNREDSDKNRNEGRAITTNNTEIHRLIWHYCKQIHASKLEDPEKFDRFLETCILAKIELWKNGKWTKQ